MSATKTELEARIEELEEEKEELQDRLDQIAGLSVPQEAEDEDEAETCDEDEQYADEEMVGDEASTEQNGWMPSTSESQATARLPRTSSGIYSR